MKTLLLSLAIFIISSLILALAAFLFVIDTSPMGKMEFLAEKGKFALFRHTGYGTLDDGEIKRLYEGTCTRKCHGRDVIERTAHTAKEWKDIVDRMRVSNDASITDAEERTVTAYLAKRYGSNIPTILSAEGGRYLKKHLWRSDFGEEDLYVDIIYTPLQYFKVVGGSAIVEGYNADRYELFKVYINTHQGRLEPYPLEKLVTLITDQGGEYEPVIWKVIYESGDYHHREGLLVFKKTGKDVTALTLSVKDLPGQKERLFIWALPIPAQTSDY